MQLGLNSLVAPGAFRMALAGAVFLHHTTFFQRRDVIGISFFCVKRLLGCENVDA